MPLIIYVSSIIPYESNTYTTQSKDADIRTKQVDKTKSF